MVFVLQHRNGLKQIPEILERNSKDYQIKLVEPSDVEDLAKFFEDQPKEAYEFFKPHGLDRQSLHQIARCKSFLTFIVKSGDTVVGYFFLRCFMNGNCFRGKIVDYRWQGRGIAKLMGKIMTEIAVALHVRMFGTIAPENYASMASSKAVNEVKIQRTLENGYYYIEYLPKK